MQIKLPLTTLAALALAASALAQSGPIKLDVDATDAMRNILHAQLHLPVKPGKLTLLYPKWLPGEHAPDGPVTDLVGLKLSRSEEHTSELQSRLHLVCRPLL